jgi:hypothetical protein
VDLYEDANDSEKGASAVKKETYYSEKLVSPTSLHGVTTLKNDIEIIAALKTSNL